MAHWEYAILESLVKDGQKATMEMTDFDEFFNDFKLGNFLKCSGKWKNLFNPSDCDSHEAFIENVKSKYAKSSSVQQWELMAVSVSCLQVFAEINFLGRSEIIEEKAPAWLEKSLELDGESICPVVKNLELLYIAKSVLDLNIQNDPIIGSLAVQWWKFRCLWLHQEILDSRSETIFDSAKSLTKIVEESCLTSLNDKGKISWHLEVSTFNLHYFDIQWIQKEVSQASELGGISVQETGILGKRTKFQQKELAQLTLNIENMQMKEDESQVTIVTLPTDLKLDDEVRLDKIAFSQPRNEAKLSLLQHAIVLAQFYLEKRCKPKDSLLKEELMPYLDVLLSSPKNWSLKFIALLERSKLERDDKRAIERTLMQVQTLVDHWPHFEEARSSLLFVAKPPAFWTLKHELVKILISVGSTKTALDYALELQLWEEVINCYHMLDLRHKAEEIIRLQIEKDGETPKLLCMLGDATDDPKHYEQAIEASNGKNARAFRSLGNYHFHRKSYDLAVDLLGKSLALNSFQLQILLRHGYAAMQLKMWDVAAQSYRNYCNYESDVSSIFF